MQCLAPPGSSQLGGSPWQKDLQVSLLSLPFPPPITSLSLPTQLCIPGPFPSRNKDGLPVPQEPSTGVHYSDSLQQSVY